MDTKEKEITRRKIIDSKREVRYIEYNLKKAVLDLEGLPLIRENYIDKITELTRKLNESNVMLKNMNETLER